jgi:hypothetical protein
MVTRLERSNDMKKKLLTLMAVILLATLTSCGGSTVDDETGKFYNYKSGEYVEIMESGTYYMHYTSYVLGTEATIKMAVDGDDSSVEIDRVGLFIRVLTYIGTLYYINDQEKKIFAVESEWDEEALRNGVFAYSGITF